MFYVKIHTTNTGRYCDEQHAGGASMQHKSTYALRPGLFPEMVKKISLKPEKNKKSSRIGPMFEKRGFWPKWAQRLSREPLDQNLSRRRPSQGHPPRRE